MRQFGTVLVALAALCAGSGLSQAAEPSPQAAIVAGELSTIAHQLALRPDLAIDFVNAEPLVKAGINVASLPRFPGGLNSMTPGQWYFLPAGELEPHHGAKFPFPLLMRATNIK